MIARLAPRLASRLAPRLAPKGEVNGLISSKAYFKPSIDEKRESSETADKRFISALKLNVIARKSLKPFYRELFTMRGRAP